MPFGDTDVIQVEVKARKEAVKLLLAVSKKQKSVIGVREWLEKKYPELVPKQT
ncbi:MAG: hypothetical protein ABIF22_00360 [bacterium]